MLTQQIVRRFATSAIRRSDHGPSGPGSNLPFSINSKPGLTVLFIVFFGSALAAPFFAVRRQLTK